MTKLTYVVNGNEVSTLAEAKALAKRESDIIKRYTPIRKEMTEKEKERRNLRLMKKGFRVSFEN